MNAAVAGTPGDAQEALARRRLEQAERRIADEARAMGEDDPGAIGRHALALAAHAALAPACDAGLLHLLRINFFYGDPERLPYWVEPRLLLAPLWRDDGRGLYMMTPELRAQLLRRLAAHYGRERMQDVATLLWRHSERRRDWADRTALRHAQQLTALNFLAPDKAADWLAQAQGPSQAEALDDAWFVAMREELPALPQPAAQAGDAQAVCEALMWSRMTLPAGDDRPDGGEAPYSVWLVHDPPGHAQRWRMLQHLHAAAPRDGAWSLSEWDVGADPDGRPWLTGGPGGDASQFPARPWDGEPVDGVPMPPNTVLAIRGIQRLPRELWARTALALRQAARLYLLSDVPVGAEAFDREVARPLSSLAPAPLSLHAFAPQERLGADAVVRLMRPLAPALAAQGMPAATSAEARRLAADALAGTDGVPERVLEGLCRLTGVRWPDVLDRGAAPFRPRAGGPLDESPTPRLLALAREYDDLRKRVDAGSRRTSAMEQVVRRMHELLQAMPDPSPDPWSRDASAGARLVAVVALRTKPAGSGWCRWLARRVIVEKPFISYQALRALQVAVEQLDETADAELEEAVAQLPPASGSFTDDRPRMVLYQRLKTAWQARQQSRALPLLDDRVLLPGATLRVTPRQATPFRQVTGAGRVVVGQPVPGAIATLAEVDASGEDAPRLLGVQRVRITRVDQSGRGGLQAWTQPAPDDPPPEPVEPDWPALLSACDALRRVEPGMAGLLDRDDAGNLDALYAVLAALPPDDGADRNILSAQDRGIKLQLAFDRLVAELRGRLRTPSAGTRIATVARLLRRRYPPAPGRDAPVAGPLHDRLAARLPGFRSATDLDTIAQALALRPDDGELWSACGAWLPLRGKPRKAAAAPLKLWPNGATLKLRLMGGSELERRRFIEHSAQWTDHANLHVVVLAEGSRGPADIRVSFAAQDGNWSYVGTDARTVPPKNATMNLGWIGAQVDEDAARGAILKQFGHALGLIQEHQNPAARIDWDIDGMMADERSPFAHLGRAQVRQMLQPMPPFEYRDFDPESVMLWRIPAEWVRTRQAFGGSTVLSASDVQLIRRLYPGAPPAPPEPANAAPAPSPRSTPPRPRRPAGAPRQK